MVKNSYVSAPLGFGKINLKISRKSLRLSAAASILMLFTALSSACTTMDFSMVEGNYGYQSPNRGATAVQGDIVRRGSRELTLHDGYVVPTDIQQAIVDAGVKITESGSLLVDGREFAADCTGTVLAAYWGAGLDPGQHFYKYEGNGVKRLYEMGDAYGLNFLDAMPSPGDVIIWDDTYDKDHNGRWGDPYTHAGIVISVTDTGQITYMHYNYARGVVFEKMNLLKPDEYQDANGNLVNSPMRMRSDRHIRPDSWLASHLIRGFIPLYDYPEIER